MLRSLVGSEMCIRDSNKNQLEKIKIPQKAKNPKILLFWEFPKSNFFIPNAEEKSPDLGKIPKTGSTAHKSERSVHRTTTVIVLWFSPCTD